MTDKPNIEIKEPQKIEPKNLFRMDHEYSSYEAQKLDEFMHENFPHIAYGGPRDKGIIVEYPPGEICSQEEWGTIMDTVLKPEIDSLDLKLRRERKIIVRFVDKLLDPKTGTMPGGNAISVIINGNREVWTRVNYLNKNRELKSQATCTMVIMHELTEIDFWSKTSKEEENILDKEASNNNFIDLESQDYRNLLDEKIANRRALRVVRRMWPNVDWGNPEDVYEEDK